MFGRVNPSGRLPYTIAVNRDDNPADVLYNSTEEVPQITYSEELLIDYRWFDAKNITPRCARQDYRGGQTWLANIQLTLQI